MEFKGIEVHGFDKEELISFIEWFVRLDTKDYKKSDQPDYERGCTHTVSVQEEQGEDEEKRLKIIKGVIIFEEEQQFKPMTLKLGKDKLVLENIAKGIVKYTRCKETTNYYDKELLKKDEFFIKKDFAKTMKDVRRWVEKATEADKYVGSGKGICFFCKTTGDNDWTFEITPKLVWLKK
ncbi:hypothetical protein KAR26_01250 [Candidatus Parcubacteria bacterium]|nr:hypothetical protein [Candidatus Parcubacteria bacterium]